MEVQDSKSEKDTWETMFNNEAWPHLGYLETQIQSAEDVMNQSKELRTKLQECFTAPKATMLEKKSNESHSKIIQLIFFLNVTYFGIHFPSFLLSRNTVE